MQNSRIRLGQLIAFCGGLVLLASLSQTWFVPVADYRGADALAGPQSAWQALDWADNALAVIAVAALVLVVVIAVTDRGDPPRLLLLVLGGAGVVIVFAGVAPFIRHELLEPARAETQTAVWVAGAASLAIVAGAHGLRLPSWGRPNLSLGQTDDRQWRQGATYYDSTMVETGFSNPAHRPDRDILDTAEDVAWLADRLR
jgi:hypothetical protein